MGTGDIAIGEDVRCRTEIRFDAGGISPGVMPTAKVRRERQIDGLRGDEGYR
jgi:hypothetical protein